MKLSTILLLSSLAASLFALAGCDKYGAGGGIKRALGDWSEVHLPQGCKAKQIAAEESSGVIVLCEDGRIFH